MAEFTYTYHERQKNWTVQDAIDAARAILTDADIKSMCINAVKNLDPKQAINMIELNQISKELVDDSIYYEI